MDSRPDQGVVRRLMWEAAAFAAEGPGEEPPGAVPPGTAPASHDEKTPAPAGRKGPGSQIRRYVPRPRPAKPKPVAPSSPEPVKPPD
jgi:hypothetical protein